MTNSKLLALGCLMALGGASAQGAGTVTAACDPTLTHNVQNYVLPVFITLFWFAAWLMTFMKLMKGELSSGPGGGWGGGCCRLFLMIACFFQSLVAFFATFTSFELETAPYMIYPLIGFIAFSSYNQRWLLLYIGTCLFAFQYSGAVGARGLYISDAWKVSASDPDVEYCSDYCDMVERLPKGECVACGAGGYLPGKFCHWGWLRTMNVFSMWSYWAFWLTTFGACSWWAEAGAGDSEPKNQLANVGV